MVDKAIFQLPGIKRMLALSCAFAAARACAIVGQAIGLAAAIANVWGGAALVGQVPWVALFFACFVARQVIASAQNATLDAYAYREADELRTRLLRAVFDEGPALVQKHGSASVSTTVIDGIESIQSYIALIIPKMVAVVVVPLAMLLVVFPLDWVSGVIALACFPFIILYMMMIGYTAQDDAAKRHGEFQRMANHFLDSLGGIDTLRAFGQSRHYGERIYAASERLRELTMKTLRIATLSSAILDVFATLALAGVAIMLGFRMVEGSVPLLPALTVLILVPEYFRPIREFASDYHASLDGQAAFASIRAILGEHAEGVGGIAATRALEPFAAAPALAFRGVGYSYPDLPQALEDISFSVEGPCKVAIIGPSGSGKSTLLRLLGGFAAPCEGAIRVNGADVPSLREHAWHERATFIPQDPFIFHASIRDNVAFYRPEASDADVRRALDLAGLAETVRDLPQGMDTLIGEGGRALSGGQAHRIALARAFLDEQRCVLLFDEPTAHLDIETERELKERMLPLMEGRLVFFATHRLHWVASMDYVIEMDRGRIAWQGSPDAWLQRRAGRATPNAPTLPQDSAASSNDGGAL